MNNFENELDKMYDAIDQEHYEMEELGLINYGDSGYYWRNPEEYEKDNRIVELESKIERLEYLLKVSDKALELACEENDLYWLDKYAHEENVSLINYLKNKAKEMMKSE